MPRHAKRKGAEVRPHKTDYAITDRQGRLIVTTTVEVVEVTVVRFAVRAPAICSPADETSVIRPAVADTNTDTCGSTVTAAFLITALPLI